MKALLAGASGFIGSRLALALRAAGDEVRCLVRDPDRAKDLEAAGCELVRGDVSKPETLKGHGEGCDVAYYLVHLMGRGSGGDFHSREAEAARNFARMAREDGVGRVIYLGGLGDPSVSQHLRSRHETAEVLSEHGPPLTYFRAAMVVGSESESYRTVRYLVQRLPAMIAPAWLKTSTQPIGVNDVISYLRQAPSIEGSTGREVQLGGPDVTTYGGMLDAMADALGLRRRPRIPVPLLTPSLSSLWIGLVTPVDAGVARPLVESLASPTVVEDPSGMELFDVRPTPFRTALEEAVAEDLGEAPTGA